MLVFAYGMLHALQLHQPDLAKSMLYAMLASLQQQHQEENIPLLQPTPPLPRPLQQHHQR